MLLKLRKTNFSTIRPNAILFIAGVCFLCISFLFIWYELVNAKKYLIYRFNEKLSIVESSLNSKIADAKHILYGLGVTISTESIISSHDNLIELIQNFDPRHGFDEEISTPLTDILFIRAGGTKNIRTKAPNNRTKNKDYLDSELCSAEKETEFFKLKVGPLRIGSGIKEQILPINMSISDPNGNYLGTLCSGLIVRELSNKLNSHFDSRYLSSIKLINRKPDKLEDFNFLNLGSILEANFLNQYIVFTYDLKKYPISLEIKLKHSFLKGAIYRFALFSLCIFIIFIGVVYFFSKSMRSYYEDSLIPVQNKLDELNKINDKNKTLLNSADSLEVKFSPVRLANSLNELIDRYYPIILEQSEQTIEQNKLKSKILNLLFIEQHFMSLQKTKIGEDKLYINKLYGLVKEEYVTLPLYEFLDRFANYCCEFYHEISIKIIVEPKDRKEFSFKQTALIETIFSIFTFILRSAFEMDDNPLIIRAQFIDNNDFPTITIEANIKGCLDPLGWEAGPHFVHTSLLAIYLLAKENKLLFNMIKEEDTIFFILDPIAKRIEFYDLAILYSNNKDL